VILLDKSRTIGRRDSGLQAELGDLQFIVADPVYQTLELGYLAFHFVKPGSPEPQGSGFDVVIVPGRAELD
jgi:hypothetical protein